MAEILGKLQLESCDAPTAASWITVMKMHLKYFSFEFISLLLFCFFLPFPTPLNLFHCPDCLDRECGQKMSVCLRTFPAKTTIEGAGFMGGESTRESLLSSIVFRRWVLGFGDANKWLPSAFHYLNICLKPKNNYYLLVLILSPFLKWIKNWLIISALKNNYYYFLCTRIRPKQRLRFWLKWVKACESSHLMNMHAKVASGSGLGTLYLRTLCSSNTHRVSNIARGPGFSWRSDWSSGSSAATSSPHSLFAFLALGPVGAG